MLLFCFTTLSYVGFLLWYRPFPESLRGTRLTLREHYNQVKASLWLGVLLLVIYFIITDFTFKQVNPYTYRLLGLSNLKAAAMLWPFQAITHLFIHANLLHVISNVIGIGIASAYERRVGSERYIAVLLVGAVFSTPSIWLFSSPSIASGISGGVFALAAAYFTDYTNLTMKEWGYAILSFVVLAVVFSINDKSTLPSPEMAHFQIDDMAHFLGAFGGIIYCRLKVTT